MAFLVCDVRNLDYVRLSSFESSNLLFFIGESQIYTCVALVDVFFPICS